MPPPPPPPCPLHLPGLCFKVEVAEVRGGFFRTTEFEALWAPLSALDFGQGRAAAPGAGAGDGVGMSMAAQARANAAAAASREGGTFM